MTYNLNGFFSRIRHSIIRGPVYPQTEQECKRIITDSLILHFRPRTVPEPALKFSLTWGLGGMALVLVMLLALTGILLKFVYVPLPGKAYESILVLQNEVWFGQLIRNIHHWCANLLVIVVFLHMLRVFFTGAFHSPRRFNWIIGLFLLFFVLISNFTGYLLPWDQLAFWAITICTGMVEYIPGVGTWLQKMLRSGPEIGPAALLMFYTFHTAILPVCLLICMAFHFWRVRKAGGVIIPASLDDQSDTKPGYVPTIPNLVLRELTVALVLVAFILVFSILFDAPLESPANPGMSPNPAKAPWYFMGIQELLMHFHPVFAVLIIPVLVTGTLILLPYLTYQSNRRTGGVWFFSRKGRRMGIVAAITALVITPPAIITDEYFMNFTASIPGLPTLISNGFFPAAIILAGITGFHRLIKRKYNASTNETIQTLFILLLVSFIILTVTGIWFRGPGMALTWPWNPELSSS
ncbi:MAG: cytochrome b N-terminal domain-containing protein [Deltaproteobacteria bacterium]|nr:cytochrome b N-terminal domain-containing protein [Deltaproteobacteria bacterium]MBW2100731.1 cytochrome b N-terminal domain-containing protein [Deltaproteobacteria bacterium]